MVALLVFENVKSNNISPFLRPFFFYPRILECGIRIVMHVSDALAMTCPILKGGHR